MKKILALALLTFRSALNSRIVLVLGILLALVLILFPLHLQGDGTLPGHIRILLEYTLGTLVAILSFSIAWTACGAVAGEVANRQLQLVLIKPVSRLSIWLGKWLGIMLLHALFLFAGGAGLYLILLGSLPPRDVRAQDPTGEWTHYTILAPQPESVDDALPSRLETARAEGLIPRQGPVSPRILNYFKLEIRRARATVAPAQSCTWTFVWTPDQLPPARPLRLRYRPAASRWERHPLPIEWHIQGDPVTPEYVLRQTASADQTGELPLPPALSTDAGRLRITGVNLATNPPTTLVFEPDQSLHLLAVHEDNGLNYFRGLLVLWARIGFLAAVGLTAGCLFSTPTALFFTLFVLLLLSLSGSIRDVTESGGFGVSHLGEAVSAGAFETPILIVHRTLNRLLAPIQSLDAIHRLGARERVTWSDVGRAWRTYVLLWGGTLLLAGLVALRRREFGKPEIL